MLFVGAAVAPFAAANTKSNDLLTEGLIWQMGSPEYRPNETGVFFWHFTLSIQSFGHIPEVDPAPAGNLVAISFTVGETLREVPFVVSRGTTYNLLYAGQLLPTTQSGQIPPSAFTNTTLYYVWGCATLGPVTGSYNSTTCIDSEGDRGTDRTFYTFAVIGGELVTFDPNAHPLAVPLTNLGIQVDLGLYLIGIIPFAIFSILVWRFRTNLSQKDYIVPFMVFAGWNIMMRFWPPMLFVFLMFFTGLLVVGIVIGFAKRGGKG